jgi:hypothetical protein
VQAVAGPDPLAPMRWKLTPGTDPNLSTGYVMRWRASISSAVGGQLTARLYQGGTLVVDQSDTLSVGINEFTKALAGPEIDFISNHSDLYMEFDHDVFDATPVVRIYLARLEIPLAGFPHLDISSSGLAVRPAQSGFYLELTASGIRRVAGTETTGALILDSGGWKVSP